MDQIKGWTRSSAAALILLAASEIDLSEEGAGQKLKPLHRILDKAWLLPCHATWLCVSVITLLSEMTFGMDEVSRSFRNLTLSFRGSERQPPNTLQLALRFSRAMEVRDEQGKVLPGASTHDRLRSVISEFHGSGLASKHQLDDAKIMAIYNLISGTCADPRFPSVSISSSGCPRSSSRPPRQAQVGAVRCGHRPVEVSEMDGRNGAQADRLPPRASTLPMCYRGVSDHASEVGHRHLLGGNAEGQSFFEVTDEAVHSGVRVAGGLLGHVRYGVGGCEAVGFLHKGERGEHHAGLLPEVSWM